MNVEALGLIGWSESEGSQAKPLAVLNSHGMYAGAQGVVG
uniref:Uncharacterized protein n=1 Tax=Pseudomonas fluorescens (strain SBW25) TaxID=216595 RepID=A0A0G4E4T5_PSEFS|nr:hypothetical protein PQBR57_0303 [Pseudomonas fluorescens SBW25]